jgi:hypothetical protein
VGVTLVPMLLEGRLGWLHLQVDRSGVLDRLGPPDDRSVRRRPEILKWGDLEVTFEEEHVHLIALYLRGRRPVIPIALEAECTSDELFELTPTDVGRLCAEHGRSCAEDPLLTFDDQSALVVDSVQLSSTRLGD